MRFVGIGLCLDVRLRDFFFFLRRREAFFFFYRSVGIGFTCTSHINIGLIYVQESHM